MIDGNQNISECVFPCPDPLPAKNGEGMRGGEEMVHTGAFFFSVIRQGRNSLFYFRIHKLRTTGLIKSS